MNQKTLFLAWTDKWDSPHWFPIGRLDADLDRSAFRFRYTGGAMRARTEVGFQPLIEFPEFGWDYRASQLFPMFQNRVINPRRPDLERYLRSLDLARGADPLEILSTNGGYRATDAYEVFPKLVKAPDGSFKCRFFLDGWRYVNADAKDRLERLTPDEELYVTLELTNPATGMAVQIQTTDYHLIGWAPRYLLLDLAQAIAEKPRDYDVRVVQVNPLPPPSKQRVLIEMRGSGTATSRWRATTTSLWWGTETGRRMSEELRIWQVSGAGEVESLSPFSQMPSEWEFEELLVGNPEMLESGLRLVGRQTRTQTGWLDLLAVDTDGRLVVYELKRGTLAREAVTQVLDYASDLDAMNADDLAEHISERSGSNGVERIDDFIQWYSDNFSGADLARLTPPRMVLIGLGRRDGERLLARQVEVEAGDRREFPERSLSDGRRETACIARVSDREGIRRSVRPNPRGYSRTVAEKGGLGRNRSLRDPL